MSDQMTGADLEHLEQLAGAYTRSGVALAAKAADLRSRIARSVGAFEASTDRLRVDTERAAATMETEIGDLSATAAGVAWTGANRLAFDADLQRFAVSVRAGAAALVEGLDALRAGGVSRFTELLEGFGASVVAAGEGLETTTSDLNRAVTTQRDQLHQAADVGWTAA